MQIWAEFGKSALPICNYSQILYQFLTFTQNLKRSRLSFFFFLQNKSIYNGGTVDLKALVLRKYFLPVHILSVDTNDQFLHLSSVTS